METITREIALGSQSVTLTEIVRIGHSKLMIEIKSDSYEHQCHARVKLWSGARWNLIHSLLRRKTPSGLYAHLQYRKGGNGDGKEFQADRDELLRVAKKVLA